MENTTEDKATIININSLLNLKIYIPDFQRPYKWSRRNVLDLLNDLEEAINDAAKHEHFEYRVGTILIWNDNGTYFIVDGLQRLITLTLIKYHLDSEFNNNILDTQFNNQTTQKNIHDNFELIIEWFSSKEEMKEKFLSAFENIAEAVVIYASKIEEAFQFFDSQNNRGKELDPHDLLKAYHLREMRDYPYEMVHAVTKWEDRDAKQIRDLFKNYLFPIWNWSRNKKTTEFSVKDIDAYKGVQELSSYTYAKRTNKSMPCFQITEPFVAGNDFFEMIDHYCNMLSDLKTEMENNHASFGIISDCLNYKNGTTGLGYAKNLFYCALLCYYDKFHKLDELAVRKLFIWAYMIRVDIEKLGYSSINNYAVGGGESSMYTNNISMFSQISFARLHTEISSLQIDIKLNDKKHNEERMYIYECLLKLKGIEQNV